METYLLSPTPKSGVISLPMIAFETFEIELCFEGVDLLLFTSKQAVKSAELLNPAWKNFPAIAIGSATAKMVRSLGGEVCYQAKKFYGEVLSEEIATRFKEKKLLYLRPQKVAFDAKASLQKRGVLVQEKILYKTLCCLYPKEQNPPQGSTIIFTSPSTIHCFLENFGWDCSYVAIVIGETTKRHLPNDAICKVAKEPTIEACLQRALGVCK
jgi:uroporphyrinogen-III synthase